MRIRRGSVWDASACRVLQSFFLRLRREACYRSPTNVTIQEPHGPARGHFLNVDLEVHSCEDLSLLAAEFEARACVLHFQQEPGANFLVVEREEEPSGPGLEAALADLCNLVESLSSPTRALWDRADLRVLDAGFDAASGRPLAQFSVPPSLLRRLVAVEARLAVTVYPEDEPDASAGVPS